MSEAILLITSALAKKVFAFIFFIVGIIVALIKGKLKEYLKNVAIINDVYLNVLGQDILNGVLSSNGKGFGNRLQTISCAMAIVKLTKFGKEADSGLSDLEKNHTRIALELYMKDITEEYNRLQELVKSAKSP